MRNIKLIIEYDGTNYGGWQRQLNTITIQECIEKAILYITKEFSEVIGCSRTDAGVHAKGFVANFHTNSSISSEKMRGAINSRLPKDIVILKSEEISENFHSRYDCVGKTYSYIILNRYEYSALNRNYAYHFKNNLDIQAMSLASGALVGTHDFASFRNIGSSVKTTVRTITQLDMVKDGDYISFYVSGDGFLYNMVRIIVGSLLMVGTGKVNVDRIKKILEAKDRTQAGQSVPPQGLYLEKVSY